MHNGKPLRRDDAAGLERVAQYIIRNPFVARPSEDLPYAGVGE